MSECPFNQGITWEQFSDVDAGTLREMAEEICKVTAAAVAIVVAVKCPYCGDTHDVLTHTDLPKDPAIRLLTLGIRALTEEAEENDNAPV